MSLFQDYARTVRDELNYRATWIPGAPMKLGDVGTIEDGVFNRHTDLETLGIPYASTTKDRPSEEFSFESEDVRSIVVKAAGELNETFEAIAEAKAGIRVEFAKERAVVLKVKNPRVQSIDNIAALDDALLDAVLPSRDSKGRSVPRRWKDRDWVVVTEVVDVDVATILCSTGTNAAIELEAETAVGPDGLVDVEAGLEQKLVRSVGVKDIARKGSTPLYRGRKVQRHWFWLYDQVVPADKVLPTADDDVFGEDYSDLED